jgi:predicted membrane channel-forming protein YqfA (hemolysin III family)
MNPYAPPIVALPQSPQPRNVSLKNPARFLLYPLAALCTFLTLAHGWRVWRSGFQFRTAEFLNAGIYLLIALFGITAFFLGARKLSKNTRVFTILWSFAAASIIVISLFFDPPTSIQELILILVIGSILLLVAILAFRGAPNDSLHPDPIESGQRTLN